MADVTHDVKYFRLEKPSDYSFTPGQATELSIHEAAWEQEKRPFTFTSLIESPWLEFTIKRYPDHHGVTDQLHYLHPGDELILREPWGAISYQGPGYFIAGGAGITPFIAILRQLYHEGTLSGSRLFFSNKTSGDIIYRQELEKMLGDAAVFVLTQERSPWAGRINEGFLSKQSVDFSKPFYICGPDPMILEINSILQRKGAKPESLVFEK